MYAHRGRNHFSLAASLEPLESVDGATELSLDGSFIAKDLVERIAITLWRQRRLVNAETASIALSRSNSRAAAEVGQKLIPSSYGGITPNGLAPFDAELERWCKTTVEECVLLSDDLNPALLPKAVPHIFRQLSDDAAKEGVPVEEYLAAREGGLMGYVDELEARCRAQLRGAEKSPRVPAVAQQFRARQLVLEPDLLELFSRYQTSLDNQLCKMLKALRETQEWRLKMLEGQTVEVDSST